MSQTLTVSRISFEVVAGEEIPAEVEAFFRWQMQYIESQETSPDPEQLEDMIEEYAEVAPQTTAAVRRWWEQFDMRGYQALNLALY